jgi:hypothetical protein
MRARIPQGHLCLVELGSARVGGDAGQYDGCLFQCPVQNSPQAMTDLIGADRALHRRRSLRFRRSGRQGACARGHHGRRASALPDVPPSRRRPVRRATAGECSACSAPRGFAAVTEQLNATVPKAARDGKCARTRGARARNRNQFARALTRLREDVALAGVMREAGIEPE